MDRRHVLMLLGFAAAFAGDWLLAVKGSPCGSVGFLFGVGAFSLAQVFWMVAHAREARFDWRVAIALAVPLGCFFGVRLRPVLDVRTAFAVGGYALLSAVALTWALSTRRRWYALGIALLLVSDLMIGNRWLGVPFAGELVGPLYVAAELSLWTSFSLRDEKWLNFWCGNPFSVGIWTAFLSLTAFFLAMASFPGGGFNPCMRMLSALGRTEIRLVEYPLCHFLFTLGMMTASLGIVRIVAFLVGTDPLAGSVFPVGAAFNVAGLLTIAAVPENVNVDVHNAGCWIAAFGGAIMLFAWLRTPGKSRCDRIVWPVLLLAPCLMLGLGLILHELKVVRFAPWVPTAQKVLILTFMCWFLRLTLQFCTKSLKRVSGAMLLALIGLGWWGLGFPSNGDRPLAGGFDASALKVF